MLGGPGLLGPRTHAFAHGHPSEVGFSFEYRYIEDACGGSSPHPKNVAHCVILCGSKGGLDSLGPHLRKVLKQTGKKYVRPYVFWGLGYQFRGRSLNLNANKFKLLNACEDVFAWVAENCKTIAKVWSPLGTQRFGLGVLAWYLFSDRQTKFFVCWGAGWLADPIGTIQFPPPNPSPPTPPPPNPSLPPLLAYTYPPPPTHYSVN